MITQAKKPKFKIGQKLISPSGRIVEIIRSYNSDGSNMYHFKYEDGTIAVNALWERQFKKIIL